jgi:membrane protein implicated in regulation of membrane protease activity
MGFGICQDFFIAGLIFVLAELLAPMLFFSILQKVQASLGLNVGPWVRLIGSALASILAFVGLWKLYPSTS